MLLLLFDMHLLHLTRTRVHTLSMLCSLGPVFAISNANVLTDVKGKAL